MLSSRRADFTGNTSHNAVLTLTADVLYGTMLDQNMAATDFRTDGTSLEMLAKDHFDRDLTVAEKNLLAKAPAGEVAFSGIPGDRTHPGNDPGKADIPEGMPWWGPDREIAADLIRWLCVDRLAREQIDQKGLQIMGAKMFGLREFWTAAMVCSTILVVTLFSLWVPTLKGASICGAAFMRKAPLV